MTKTQIVINGVKASEEDLKTLMKNVAMRKDVIKSITTNRDKVEVKTL